MQTAELLNVEERKDKIRKLIANLNARANEMLWSDPLKVERMKRYKPTSLEEFWKRWDELDARCAEYLEGKIEWAGDSMQMEFMPESGVPYPVLKVDRDVENFARDLFCWMALEVQALA